MPVHNQTPESMCILFMLPYHVISLALHLEFRTTECLYEVSGAFLSRVKFEIEYRASNNGDNWSAIRTEFQIMSIDVVVRSLKDRSSIEVILLFKLTFWNNRRPIIRLTSSSSDSISCAQSTPICFVHFIWDLFVQQLMSVYAFDTHRFDFNERML